MASVIAFLFAVVLAIQLNYLLTKPFVHLVDDDRKQKAKAVTQKTQPGDEETLRIVAAAVAAIHQERKS